MRRLPPTKRQRDLERFLKKYIENEGMSPTYLEIGNELGITLNAARMLVKQLIKRGRAQVVPRTHRTVELVGPSA